MNIKNVGLICLVALLCCVSSVVWGLAGEYQRNGEVYLLVGDGAKKGVYRLNDPASDGVAVSGVTPLYDPGKSYGMSVNLNRHVFTFTETIADIFTMMSGNIEVNIKASGKNQLQGFHCDHRSKWAEHFRPIYTSPGPAANYPGYYTLTPTSFGYTASRNVGSCCGCGAPRVANSWPVYVISPGTNGKASIPNGMWYQSNDNDTHGRPGKAYRDRVEGKCHSYDLLEWYTGISGNTPVNQGKRAESYEKRIARAILGSCIDPCGTNQDSLTQDAQPQYVSISLSSMGRTYCYTRTQSSTSDGKVTLNLANYTGPLIRAPRLNDLTTEWVGCSLKNTSSDYVYVLGSKAIEDWLRELGFAIPAGFKVTAVSVSDQWYLKGGIVFAYNSSNGMAYQFTRSEGASGSEGTTTYFRGIGLGTGIDDIKADGFGNMYYGKTAYFPNAASSFSSADASAVQWTAVSIDTGVAKGRIIYDQKVTKSVYRLALGATSETLVNSVVIGTDKWEQFFRVPITLADGRNYSVITKNNYTSIVSTPDWSWIDSLPRKDAAVPSISLPQFVQLGVINVATPPDPGASSSTVDIVGPTNDMLEQVTQGYYSFKVENPPRWERDDWNANNLANVSDENDNGTIGYFAATASKAGTDANSGISDHVLYEWSIYKTQDAYGNVISPADLVANSGSSSVPEYTTSPGISYYLPAGVYQIMCRAKYKWYNYNLLAFGSTVASKSMCLTPAGFEQAIPALLSPDITAANFPGMVAVPSGCAVAMLKVNLQEPIDKGKPTLIQCKGTTSTTFKDPLQTSTGVKYFAVNENTLYNWRLKEEEALFTLPNITDDSKVGDVKWVEDFVGYSWQYKMMLPTGLFVQGIANPKVTDVDPLTRDRNATIATFKLDFPTDPVLAELTCEAFRMWKYNYKKYNEYGIPIGIDEKTGVASYSAKVALLVLDNTPPQVIRVNGKSLPNLTLKGATGETLTSIGGNPEFIEVTVRDNNPFGNIASACLITGISNHSPKKQVGTLQFECGAGKNYVPRMRLADLATGSLSVNAVKLSAVAGDDFTGLSNIEAKKVLRYSAPGFEAGTYNSDVFKIVRTPSSDLPGGATFSEVVYKIALSDLQHFDNTGVTDSGRYGFPTRLPLNFANNSPNYNGDGDIGFAHPGYGLAFSAMDSSGYRQDNVMVGNIDVIDNKRPVLYMVITDMKTTESTSIPLFDSNQAVNETTATTTVQSLYDCVTSAVTWTPGATAVFGGFTGYATSTIYGLPVPPITDFSKYAVISPPLIENEVETILELKFFDNIGVATSAALPSFSVVGPDAASIYFKEGMPTVTVKGDSQSNYKARAIFRHPGVYKISAEVKDTALDYSRKDTPNNRKLEFGLIIVPSTMDIRVINREVERR
ncbi:MAG: hypothetical protein KKB51_03040 [Candidatus Riflebacteria bacterium]|nr:hypothetical protein [Candidatus Riflebacteria bacterium]